jgi:hypothetical protein
MAVTNSAGGEMKVADEKNTLSRYPVTDSTTSQIINQHDRRELFVNATMIRIA